MKQIYSSIKLKLLIAAIATIYSTGVYAQGEVNSDSPSNGISLKSQSTYSTHYTVRVDDAVIGDSKAFTISAWVYVDGAGGQLNYSNYPILGLTNIKSLGNSTNIDVWLLNGTFSMQINNSIYGTEQSGELVAGANNAAKGREWVLLAISVDDVDGKAAFYYDGVLTQTYEFEPGTIFRQDEETMFHLTNTSSKGSIATRFDDLKICNRTLTIEEIDDLKYAYQPDNIPDYLAGYYSFDENDGTVNEYANQGNGGEQYVAQVQQGQDPYSDYYMEFSGKLSSTNAAGEGIVNEWAPYKYMVTINATGPGSVTVMNGETEVTSGTLLPADTEITITATPDENCEVESITVNGNPFEGSAYTVTSATEINVAFTTKTAQIAADNGTNEGGSYILADPDSDEEFEKTDGYYNIAYGTEVEIVATPAEGFRTTAITIQPEDGQSSDLDPDNPVFTIAADSYTIQVDFIEMFTITYSAGEGGTISVTANNNNVTSGSTLDDGTEVTVTASPDDGYELESLTVNGNAVEVDAEGTYTFNIQADTEMTATFSKTSGVAQIGAGQATRYDIASQSIITDGNAQIAIYGIDGKMLLSGMGNTLSVAGLDGGIYIATINNGKTTEKIKFRK